MDRRRARGSPSGARPGPGGRRVAGLRRRPELPHARCPTGAARDLGRDHGPGDRATRARIPEGERRSARSRAGGGGAAARARGSDRAAIGPPSAWPGRGLRGRGPHRRIAHRRGHESAASRAEREAADRDGEGARRGRGGEPRGRPRAQRLARDRGRRGHPLRRTGRFSGKRRRRSTARSWRPGSTWRCPALGGLLAWSPKGSS